MVRIILFALALSAMLAASAPSDRIAELQQKINSGEIRLDHEPAHGYLVSLLKHLKIPVSSQSLVFSKSNFQLHLVAPDRPRALYFNDDVYIGWVQGAPDIEVAVVDPKTGPAFYTLPQTRKPKPVFERQSVVNCIVCHDSSPTETPVPRLLMLSILPDPNGSALKALSLITNDQSPLVERWGGWYVSGTHGAQRHMGNTVVRAPAAAIKTIREYIPQMDLSDGANVTDLSKRFNTKPYLSPHSDMVALMVLGHQTHVQNLMAVAASNVRGIVDNAGESIVRAMLFVKEAPLSDPVKGASGFAEEFPALGPRDSKGRSLRDLDLKTRLFRYPLSYLVYSQAFDSLPESVKTHVYRRFREILSGQDKDAAFAHLSESDRRAILEILQETKPEFRSFLLY